MDMIMENFQFYSNIKTKPRVGYSVSFRLKRNPAVPDHRINPPEISGGEMREYTHEICNLPTREGTNNTD